MSRSGSRHFADRTAFNRTADISDFQKGDIIISSAGLAYWLYDLLRLRVQG